MSTRHVETEEDGKATDETARGEGKANATAEVGERSEQTDRGTPASEGPNNNDSQDDNTTTSTTIPQGVATYTPRFAGFIILFAVLTAFGVITFHPAAIAAAGTLLVFILAGLIQTPAHPATHLTATYTVTPEHPRPAEPVTIEATITNNSEKTFTDLRVIDTVPDALRVTGGTPRATQALRPGETLTFTYTVPARRGTYAFGPPIARTRTLLGSMWFQEQIPTSDTPEFRCAVQADDIPLDERATHYIGGLLGQDGGDGVEFHSTREYHRGDSPSRINWRELAKRGELSTITYREQQAAEVTIISDARMWSRVSAGPGTPSAATLAIYAAYQLTTTLTAEGHYVGMVVPGMQPTDVEQQSGHGFPYRRFDHGRGMEQQKRAFNLLTDVETTVTSTTYSPGDTAPLRDLGTGNFRDGRDGDGVFDVNPYHVPINGFVHDLTAWASPNTQFIFITPLLDDGAHGLCTQLHNMGYSVVVISPDITTQPASHDTPSDTTGPGPNGVSDVSRRMLRVQRATRIESLRHKGFTVIDWDPEEPLAACCERQTLPGER